MKTQSANRARGFTLTELLVVFAVIAILAGICLASLAKSKAKGTRIKCVGNLKQVGLGFRVFANDNGDRFPYRVDLTNYTTGPLTGYFSAGVNPTLSPGGTALSVEANAQPWTHFLAMSNELGSAKILMCPGDRKKLYNIKSDFTTGMHGYNVPSAAGVNSGGIIATLTYNQTSVVAGVPVLQGKDNATAYTVGLQADETQPNVILSVDRNYRTANGPVSTAQLPLAGGQTMAMDPATGVASWVFGIGNANAARHDTAGNYALSDGSVQQATSAGLQVQLRQASSGLGVAVTISAFPL